MVLVVADIGVRDSSCDGRLLYQPVEQHSPRSGRAAVEAEGKFVEIVVKVPWIYRPMMGAKQPPFEQRSNPMHARQGPVCRGLRSQEDERNMSKSFVLE